jgi:hypothetical protein
MLRLAVVILALLAASLGCYRTNYVNFHQSPVPPSQHEPVKETGWQHFFVWGWFPIEKRIDATEKCGGAEKIESIRTRRTFLEGLVAAFAGYYVNIYSPWHGAVYCTEKP